MQPSYVFVEGDNGEVCIGIDGTLIAGNSLTVELQLDLDTAIGTYTANHYNNKIKFFPLWPSAIDVLSTTVSVIFNANTVNMVECTSTNPLTDGLFEMPETFTVRINSAMPSTQFAVGSEDTAIVTVLDLEGLFCSIPSEKGKTCPCIKDTLSQPLNGGSN